MKKLIFVGGLLVIAPAMGMQDTLPERLSRGTSSPVVKELVQLSTITSEESSYFLKHFGWAVGAFDRKIQEKVYSENHAFCKSLFKLRDDLNQNCSNITILLKGDKDLRTRIEMYRAVDSNVVIKRALDQVRNNQGDVKKAKDLVIQTRRVLSELRLQEMQPQYSPSLIGEIDTKERENFILRNNNYPTDDNAVKDYTALFIYLTLVADTVE